MNITIGFVMKNYSGIEYSRQKKKKNLFPPPPTQILYRNN
jgi:hypothetical protein